MGLQETYLFTTQHGCGRYVVRDPKKIKKRFNIQGKIADIAPNYNAAPTQDMPIVLRKNGNNLLEIMKWGVVPVWAKDKPNFGYHTFNAKAETLEEKPMWKGLFRKHRCLVPADAYYEWKTPKHPYLFHLKDNRLFAFAGLFSAWTDENTREIVKTYTIITTTPNKLQKPIHDRMPVILEKREEDIWLDEGTEADQLVTMLNPYKGKDFDLYPVTADVGSAKNNNANLLKPVAG